MPTPIEIESANEPWGEYRLSDGSVLRIKLVVVEVRRKEGEYAPDGNPLYEVQLAPVIATRAPEHLRRPAQTTDR